MSGSINRREFEKKKPKSKGVALEKDKKGEIILHPLRITSTFGEKQLVQKKINCSGRSELHGSPQHEVLAAVDRQIYLTLGGLIDSP